MKRVLLVVVPLILLATGAVWWWYSRPAELPFHLIMSGPSTYSNDFGISGGNLMAVTGKPGVCFGTVRRAKEQEMVAYVLLFRCDARLLRDARHHPESRNMGVEMHASSDGRLAECKWAITMLGRKISVHHKIEKEATPSKGIKETLLLNGNPVELTAGRVFLLDLAPDTPTYRQRNVPMPDSLTPLNSWQDVERIADSLWKQLEGKDEEVRTFLQ